MYNSLKDLLNKTKISPDKELEGTFKTTLDQIFSNLKTETINTNFRDDLLKIISTSLSLVNTLSSKNYNIDEVVSNVSFVQTRLSFILNHIISARPRIIGWGIVNQQTGQLLPNFFLHHEEGVRYLKSIKDLSYSNTSLVAVSAEIATVSIPQPITAPLPPPLPIMEFTTEERDEILPNIFKESETEKEKKASLPPVFPTPSLKKEIK